MLLAEIKQGAQLVKLFKETQLTFNFSPGQVLTTYAYEVDKKSLPKLKSFNFVHASKASKNDTCEYFPSPRLCLFSENETLKAIGFKVYRDVGRLTMLKVFEDQLKALSIQETTEDQQVIKAMYQSSFLDSEQRPYELVVCMKDG